MNKFELAAASLALSLLMACDSSSGPTEIQTNKETSTAEETAECCLVEEEPLVAPPEGDVWHTDQFTLDLYSQVALMAETNENFVFSPTSIATALGMLHGGAEGVTKDEISNALGLDLSDYLFHQGFQELTDALLSRNLNKEDSPGDLELSIHNAAWLDLRFDAHPEYLALLDTSYQANFQEVNFHGDTEGARQTINDAVLEWTNGLIEELIPIDVLDGETALVLTNTVYFKGQWRKAFEESLTSARPFYNLDGSVSEPESMAATLKARHVYREDVHVVALPYTNDDLELVVLIPDEGDFYALESNLEPNRLNQFMADLTEKTMDVELPRFSLKYNMEVKEVLMRMGIIDAFDEYAADLSRMSPYGDQLYVKDALHQATFEVDEAGTEASAATAIVVNDRSASLDNKSIIIDRPFIFGIYDRPTESFLFLGRVVSL